jgi:hypothetical protein
MCVHACLLTCLSLSVQIAEAFKLLFSKGTLQIWMACWLSRNWWIFIQTVQHQLRQKYFFREFKRQQQQSTNFFSSRIISSCVSYSEGEDIFLFVWLFVFALCIFVCVSLSLVVLCVIGCHTYFLKRSSECPLISFDKDQPNTILSQRLRTTWEVPLHLDPRWSSICRCQPLNETPKASPLPNETWQNPLQDFSFLSSGQTHGGSGVA